MAPEQSAVLRCVLWRSEPARCNASRYHGSMCSHREGTCRTVAYWEWMAAKRTRSDEASQRHQRSRQGPPVEPSLSQLRLHRGAPLAPPGLPAEAPSAGARLDWGCFARLYHACHASGWARGPAVNCSGAPCWTSLWARFADGDRYVEVANATLRADASGRHVPFTSRWAYHKAPSFFTAEGTACIKACGEKCKKQRAWWSSAKCAAALSCERKPTRWHCAVPVHEWLNDAADEYRARLPAVGMRRRREGSAGRDAPAASSAADTLVLSAVWPTNFGESLAQSWLPMLEHRPAQLVLLAGTGRLAEEWFSFKQGSPARMWSEMLELIWPGARVGVLTNDTARDLLPHRAARLRLSTFRHRDRRRAPMQHLLPSLLGAYVRGRLRAPPRPPTPPIRVAIATRRGGRRIRNEKKLLDACESHWPTVRCELLWLNASGCVANVRRVLPFHALVGLHGAHMTYAAFPQRPFAVLEVVPFPMPEWRFERYTPAVFQHDTWVFSYHASASTHRNGQESGQLQHQAADLPLPVWNEFLSNLSARVRFPEVAPGLSPHADKRAALQADRVEPA